MRKRHYAGVARQSHSPPQTPAPALTTGQLQLGADVTAVHDDRGAGHPGRGVGDEQQERAVEIFEPSVAALPNTLLERVGLRALEQYAGDVGEDVARRGAR